MRWLRFAEDWYVPAPVYAPELPVMIGYCGKSRLDRSVVNSRVVSDVTAVELVVRGKMGLAQAGARSVIGPGEVFVLKAGVPHTYAPATSAIVKKYFIQLLGPVPAALVPTLPDHLRPDDAGATRRRFEEILRVSKDRRPGCEAVLSVLGYELLVHLRVLAARAGPVRHALPAPVERALRFLGDALDRTPRVRDVAAAAGVSPPHLHHLFRRHFGVAPATWHRRRKIEEAKRLLANESVACKTVALDLGFRDPLYFSAAFKRETGMSPTAWRNARRAR